MRWLVMLLITAGAHAATPINWEDVGSPEFRGAIQRIVGSYARDCGLLQITAKPTRAQRKTTLDCLADARKRGGELAFGVSTLSGNWYVQDVLAVSARGEQWLLSFRRSPIDDLEQIRHQRCAVVSVDERTLVISGKDCVEQALPPEED